MRRLRRDLLGQATISAHTARAGLQRTRVYSLGHWHLGTRRENRGCNVQAAVPVVCRPLVHFETSTRRTPSAMPLAR